MSIERGRVALVTGSTSGIGREVARSLAEAGARVVVTGRDEERGEELVGEISGAGGEAVFVAHDLEDTELRWLVESAEGAFGRGVDILVNNGGTLMAAPTPEVDAGTIDWAFRLNVRSAFLLTGALAPGMAQRGWGRIINISSISGPRRCAVGRWSAATTSPRRPRRRPTPSCARSSAGEENQMSIFPTKNLLATDGSGEARLAARTAVELTQKTDSELHAFHVVDVASSKALLYPEEKRRVRNRTTAPIGQQSRLAEIS